MKIIPATTPDHYAAFAKLLTEYVDWFRTRYHDDLWFVDRVFGHQSLEEETKSLSQSYGPPHGKTLLAVQNDEICGGVAYRTLPDGACEMKRLFVSDRFKGQGIGRALSEAIMQEASKDGFSLMRLDSATRLTEAIAMYRSLGFRDCPPYLAYPEDLMPFLVFMELPLPKLSPSPR